MPNLENSPQPAYSQPTHPRVGRALMGLAMVLLLMCVTARAFLSETPFRVSAVRSAAPAAFDEAGLGAGAASGADAAPPSIDRSELARVSFAIVLLAALVCWIIGSALTGKIALNHRPLAVLMLAFAVLGYVSSTHASDLRSAANGFLEQASLLAAAFLAAQLFGDRRRFVLLLVVLAAVGATLAAKSYAQYFMEIPDRIAQFTMYRNEQLKIAGIAPGTPQAAAFENRLRDTAVTGFFGLANLLASLLIVLLMASAGLAADKFLHARQSLAAWRQRRLKGDLHTPTLAAVIAVILAAAIVPVLLMTRSRGGIIAALAALASWAMICRFRQGLARHWKKAVIVSAVALALCSAGVAAYGLKYDRLPSKTLTFRWHYWTASAQIVQEHPLWGVGPGNFPSAYLSARRPAAEEAVKMPHNFVMHSLAEMGLPAGLCYLAIIGYVLVGICRPRTDSRNELEPNGLNLVARPPSGVEHEKHAQPRAAVPQATGYPDGLLAGDSATSSGYHPLILLPILAAPAIGRILFAGSGLDSGLLIYDVALPTAVLLMMLLGAGWFGGRLLGGLDLPERTARIAVGCGVAAFLLHNMIEFGLFMPGTATAFWVAAGACMARSGGERTSRNRPQDQTWRRDYAQRMAVLLPLIVIAGAIWQFWWPVQRRTELTQKMVVDYHKGRLPDAAKDALGAARADPLDPYAAADASRVLMQIAPHSAGEWASDWAKAAVARDRANSSFWHIAADADLFDQWPDALNYAWSGLPSDLAGAEKSLRSELQFQPQDPTLLSRLAGVVFAQNRAEEAADLLKKAIAAVERPEARSVRPSPMLRVLLGDVLHQIGRKDQARAAWRKAAELAGAGERKFLDLMAQAVALNPNDSRLRIDFAQMLLWAGQGSYAETQLLRAMWLSAQLSPESVERLSESELSQVRMLQARAACLAAATGAQEKIMNDTNNHE